MAAGIGVVSYGGTPLVSQPPLYPALLAIIDLAFGIDPLTSASVVNAVLFGLIVYLTGVLLSRHLTSSVAFLLVGVATVLFSPFSRSLGNGLVRAAFHFLCASFPRSP
jgi:hypothetical protein